MAVFNEIINMEQSKDNKIIPMTSFGSGKTHQARNDVYYYTNQIVNLIFVGTREHWVLIDTGMPKSAKEIVTAAEKIFGPDSWPVAIILTHGHFDHVGNVVELVQKWVVPVYAHLLEFPYLTGKKPYPEPDPGVEGGLLAKLSFIYPRQPVDISEVLHELPSDNSVPEMPGWKWIHTPGHCEGHVSLFRESDRTLIAGDAFVTVRADSFYKVLVNEMEVNGPPRYLTTDWKAAEESVQKLQALNPGLVITGHGPAVSGEELHEGLARLVKKFGSLAVPEHGRYVKGERGS
jgi:glyoxylase-like metal-dependent hydrolase (beta-lactamase superfamily II)